MPRMSRALGAKWEVPRPSAWTPRSPRVAEDISVALADETERVSRETNWSLLQRQHTHSSDNYKNVHRHAFPALNAIVSSMRHTMCSKLLDRRVAAGVRLKYLAWRM